MPHVVEATRSIDTPVVDETPIFTDVVSKFPSLQKVWFDGVSPMSIQASEEPLNPLAALPPLPS